MKNRLLPLVFVLGCYSAYSQVGVGTLNPHEASKLQVFEGKHNKGILIPSVALTGTSDATTVKNLDADANSLLVYNTANVSDVTEGYYYWTAVDRKWNRIINANDLSVAIANVGGNGIAGATGAPGTPGAITTLDAIIKDPNGDIYAYVGTKTTAAERSTEWEQKSPNWVKINGLNGTNGIAGATGEPGAPGAITTLDAIIKDPNGDIYAYVGTKTTTAERSTEWEQKSPNWVKINGVDGTNGIAGATGVPGTPGAITTLDAIIKDPNGDIYAYVGTKTTAAERSTEWEQKSPNWVKINGLNGTNGIAGATGAPGTPGAITTLDAIIKDPNGDIYAYVGTKTTAAERSTEWEQKSPNWVKINGVDGTNGIAGATGAPGTPGAITTLDAIIKDPNGDIYAYVGTKTTAAERSTEWEQKSPNWVKINGLNGTNGIAGATGAPGAPGAITTLDAIIKDPNGDIYAYVGTKTTAAERSTEWEQKSPNWVKINGLNGTNGIAGATGAPGAPGAITTLDAIIKDPNGDIYAYVGTKTTAAERSTEWEQKSPNWVKINNDANGKGSLTSEDGLITIGGAAAGTDVLYADAALKINGGLKGQVLTTTDAAGKVEWQNPVSNKLSLKKISSNDTLDVNTDNVIIIDASTVTGNLTFTLPTVTDESFVGKVFTIKRIDNNDDAFVKAVVTSGTIDEADNRMTIGQSNSYQIILESVSPLKWQTLSKF